MTDNKMFYSDKIKRQLWSYIEDNYVEISEDQDLDIVFHDVEKGAGDSLSQGEAKSLDSLVNSVGETFSQLLLRKIDERGLTDAEVYKRAGIDRKLFSKIRSNPSYHPRKSTILALAISLKLSLEETVDILARAEYALSPGNKGDLIVKFFIEHGIYDIDTINYVLNEYDQDLLS